MRDQARHDVLEQFALFLRQVLQQLLHLAVGQQVRHVVLEQLGEMGRQHGRGIDHRIALQRGFLLQAGIDPGRRQSEGRLDGVDAGHADLVSAGVHDHELVRPDPAGAGIHFLDLDDVGVGLELHIVEDAHRRHHKAHLDRERAAQRLDLLGEAVGAVGAVHQRQQRIAELDLEIVDLERGRDRLFCRRARRGSGRRRRGNCGLGCPGGAIALVRLQTPARRRRRPAAGTGSSECPAAAPAPASRRPTCRAPADSRRAASSAPCRQRR